MRMFIDGDDNLVARSDNWIESAPRNLECDECGGTIYAGHRFHVTTVVGGSNGNGFAKADTCPVCVALRVMSPAIHDFSV